MCDICDKGISLEEFIDGIKNKVKKEGISVIGVEGSSPFIYTVGLTEKRLPELFMIVENNNSIDIASKMIFRLADMQIQDGEIPSEFSVGNVNIITRGLTDLSRFPIVGAIYKEEDGYCPRMVQLLYEV